MRELRVPKLNNNDGSYILVEWCIPDAERVAVGDSVATVETSKASEDLVAAEGGVLHHLVSERAECPVGAVIGYLFDSEEERAAFVAGVSTLADEDLVITAPAQTLMRELGLTRDDLRGHVGKVVKRVDVERLTADRLRPATLAEPEQRPRPPGEVHQQSRGQQAVASVVTTSHAAIPAAFVAVDVVDDLAEPARRAHGVAGGVTPLLLKAIGAVRATHPLCFGTYRGGGEVVVPEGAHVAVTFDVGHGLHLPVVRDVALRGVRDLAADLERLRDRARAGAYTEAELAGANIGLSLHTYHGVVAAVPLITPGLTAMLCLCATRPELYQTRDGAVAGRSVFQLGMAYDHRVVNGRDAIAFLRAIKGLFERADRVEQLFL